MRDLAAVLLYIASAITAGGAVIVNADDSTATMQLAMLTLIAGRLLESRS